MSEGDGEMFEIYGDQDQDGFGADEGEAELFPQAFARARHEVYSVRCEEMEPWQNLK